MLVVGASSGIGRALAVAAGAAGARVALAARRLDLVEEAAQAIRDGDGDGGALAMRCDVTSEADCRSVVDDAVAWLGGLDDLVVMAGSSPLVRIADADAATWRVLLETNLVGAALVIGRAVAHLRAGDHPVVVVTTHSMGLPWPGLGAYAATKAALAELARGLRREEPGIRALTVSVGPTATAFAESWDPVAAGAAFEEWAAAGLLRHAVLQADEMAGAILRAMGDPTGGDEILIAGEETGPLA
jgi:NAD(P)-dependent dehydrogenase (short-subunit alcohol dehydrogenase family)